MSLSVATLSRPVRPMLLLVMCMTLLPQPGFAQALTTATLSQFYHQAWGVREGVPGSITSIAQTTDGYLWLANPSGLYRFDGVRFDRFVQEDTSRPQFNPGQLAAGSDGALWITHRGAGVSRLAGGRFTSYTDGDGVPPGQILSIAADRSGAIWVAGAAGVARFTGNRWEKIGAAHGAPERGASALFVDRDNAVWIGAAETVFILPQGTERARPTAVTGLIRGFAQHPDGTVWVGNADGKTWSVSADGSAIKAGPFPAQSRPLLFDHRGALWRASTIGGIDRTVLESGSAASHLGAVAGNWFDALDGLTANDVFDIFQDRESNVWVGTGGGLDLFRETPLVAAPLPKNAHASRIVADDDGAIWAGGENFPLMRLHRGVVSTFPVPAPIWAIHRDAGGDLWVWGGRSLWRGAHGAFTRMPDPPFRAFDESASAIASDGLGRVWVSFPNHGLWTFSDGLWSPVTIPGLSPGSGLPRLATRDSGGRVWLAFRGGPLVFVDGDQITIGSDLASLALGTPVALAHGAGRTWIGLERGLVVMDAAGTRLVQGLNESTIGRIKGVVESKDGGLWLNADRGIVQIEATEVQRLLSAPATVPRLRVLDYLDGGIGGAVLVPAQSAVAGTDGRLWFVGFDSVVSIDPATIPSNPLPPPVHIETLRAAGHEYRASDSLELPVGTTNIQIKYTGLSLTMPGRVRFRYLLEGVDAEWQDAGTRREAFYTNLTPGPYAFRVVASNNDGVWNETGASLAFVIPPAYYQTNAFRAAIAVGVVGLVIAVYRLRVRQVTSHVRLRLEERRSERERIARELHDTLLQGLQGLILKFQAIATKLPPGDATAGAIESALERADRVLIESRDRVRDLRVSPESGAEVGVALAAIGDDLSHGTALTFRATVDGQPRALHPIVRDEAYWIGREALVNAFQHSNGKHIETEVSYGSRELRILCRDDGRGVAAEVLAGGPSAGHWGIHGMRERAARAGGSLDVRSRPSAGTEVELRVPARMAYAGAARSWWPRWRRVAAGGGVS